MKIKCSGKDCLCCSVVCCSFELDFAPMCSAQCVMIFGSSSSSLSKSSSWCKRSAASIGARRIAGILKVSV